VNDAERMSFGERAENLAQYMAYAAGGLGPISPHQNFEIGAVEVLHRVIEDVFRRATIIVDGHRIRMGKRARDLHLALEASHRRGTGPLGRQELECRGAPQERVSTAIDDAHAAFADLRLQRVLSELAGLLDGSLKTENDERNERGEGDRQ
jgi:hypothetical protein